MSNELLDQYLEERVYGPMCADGWPGFDNPEDEIEARKTVEKSLDFAVYSIVRLFTGGITDLIDRANKLKGE